MARKDGSNFLEVSFAFLLGSLVGATIALLYAPSSGEQTRRKIREASGEMQANVRDQYGRIRDKAEIEMSRMKDRAYEGVDKAKGYYQDKKSKVRDAFEQGKRAYEEEQAKEEITTGNEKA
jgi:gas vesicle protein